MRVNAMGGWLVLLSSVLGACEIHVDHERDDPQSGGGALPPEEPWQEPCCQTPQPPIEEIPLAETSRPVVIDRFKSLLLVDDSVLTNSRARNDVEDAPWSFRSQLGWLAGSSANAPLFALDWLERWATLTEVGPALAPLTPRPAVRRLLIEPWQTRLEPYDLAGPFERARTPFRLLAIVNRSDLSSEACAGSAGELRFVYTAENTLSKRPLPLTVVVEIPYPPSRTPQGWARAFANLSDLGFGERLNVELEALTREVMREADLRGVRVRSNELALGADRALPWEMREFRLANSGSAETASLVQVPLESTPRTDLAPSLIDDHVEREAGAALAGQLEFPPELRAGAAQITSANFKWRSTRITPPLLGAFSRNTCNGCHGGETEALPFQHIAAANTGAYAPLLSRFLYDPVRQTGELVRREARLRETLAVECEPSPTYP